jgi:hypothetical protein
MGIEKQAVKEAVESLLEQAEGCFDRARDQHKIADRQRALANKQRGNAERLVVIGQTLEADAAKLDSEIESGNDLRDAGTHEEHSREANVDRG